MMPVKEDWNKIKGIEYLMETSSKEHHACSESVVCSSRSHARQGHAFDQGFMVLLASEQQV
jgi:hypothetical protein